MSISKKYITKVHFFLIFYLLLPKIENNLWTKISKSIHCDVGGGSQKHEKIVDVFYGRSQRTKIQVRPTFFAQFCELATAASFTIILNRSTNKKE